MNLDLSRTEVQDYVIDAMKKVFSAGKVSYVKWDMNRIFSDRYSTGLPTDRQGEFQHRYYIGLYRIMKELTESFPDILFEGCSAGGIVLTLEFLATSHRYGGVMTQMLCAELIFKEVIVMDILQAQLEPMFQLALTIRL